MKLNGASLLIEKLVENGVDTVFGYPGGAVLPIYDELFKNQDRIHHVMAAHEQGASFAADGYARSHGKVGVIIATSGPGATNIVTGIANAHLDSVPVVAITGNVASSLSGKDSFQEVDIVLITSPVVKHSYVVRDVKKLSSVIDEAFKIANSGRRGPVLIDIPKDVQTQEVEYDAEKIFKTPIMNNLEKKEGYADLSRIDEVVNAIKNSKRPCIYSGGGVIASNTGDKVKKLAEKIDSPVILSLMGLGALEYGDKYNLGMCGMHGSYVSTMTQDKCDLLIALGVRFSDRATGDLNIYTNDKTIIHIDIDSSELEKNVDSKINVEGDLKIVLDRLLELVDEKENKSWWDEIDELRKISPEMSNNDLNPMTVLYELSDRRNKNTNVVTDVGQHQMFTTLYYKFKRGDKFLSSGGLGSMGYGLGASIGAAVDNKDMDTVLVTGDGSFGMNLNELSTAVTEELPITIVLLNNRSLGMVRQWQSMFFGKRLSHTNMEEKRTDFVKVAQAFGADAVRVTTLDEFKNALDKKPKKGPYLIECMVDEEQKVFPMVPPGGSAKTLVIKE